MSGVIETQQTSGSTDFSWETFAEHWAGRETALHYHPALGVLEAVMQHTDRPNVTLPVVEESVALLGKVSAAAGRHPLNYFVLRSARPDVFNYGGDFALFLETIETRDAERLHRYGRGCVKVVHDIHALAANGTITIAAVAGEAMGGGLELALSTDFIIAEKTAKLGVPESRFAGFPGMGAYSLLRRKLGRQEAESLILSGRVFDGAEGFEIGVVDQLAEPGGIEDGLWALLRKMEKKRNTYRSLVKARRHYQPVRLAELEAIVDDWVDGSMAMSGRDQSHMRRLLGAQAKASGAEVVALHPGAEAQRAPNPFRKA
jgi:DSF synthase